MGNDSVAIQNNSSGRNDSNRIRNDPKNQNDFSAIRNDFGRKETKMKEGKLDDYEICLIVFGFICVGLILAIILIGYYTVPKS
jgi:hypothetical protein